MSTFQVPIKRIRAIEEHPNADAIEFAVIDGYRSIVRKGDLARGELVAYIPEASIVPEAVIRHLGLWDEEKGKGKLSGKGGNRVSAIKLRGQISQGLCYPLIPVGDMWLLDLPTTGQEKEDEDEIADAFVLNEGDDVASLLVITKWEPEIPVSMAGEVWNAGRELTISFDIENIKSFPDILIPGEPIILTENLHGTFTGITVLPLHVASGLKERGFGKYGNILIWSKGLGAKGLVFKNNEANAKNLYTRATQKLLDALDRAHEDGEYPYDLDQAVPYVVMGETFGPGVQDLTYTGHVEFRVFAVANKRTDGLFYLPEVVVKQWLHEIGNAVEMVPTLYSGPYSPEIVAEHTVGKTTLGNHIREGVVITTPSNRVDPSIGRVILKSVSEDYLTRKGGTEYN